MRAGVIPALTHLFQLSTHMLISQRVESGVFEQEKQYAVEALQKTKVDGWIIFLFIVKYKKKEKQIRWIDQK